MIFIANRSYFMVIFASPLYFIWYVRWSFVIVSHMIWAIFLSLCVTTENFQINNKCCLFVYWFESKKWRKRGKNGKINEKSEWKAFSSHFRSFEKKIENRPQNPKFSKWGPSINMQARTQSFGVLNSSIYKLSKKL